MTILLTGATGFIGQKLVERLFVQGNTKIRVLTRSKSKATSVYGVPVEAFEWDPEKGDIEENAIKDVHCIIHLAGEGVADGRWTQSKKSKIKNSRINSTNLLVRELLKQPNECSKLICASAIGYYGDRDDETLTEESPAGIGFLPDVCKAWEQSALLAEASKVKVHSLRIGIVLSPDGGALAKMLPVFSYGLGGKLGSGEQYMSWIHIDDLIEQFIFLVNNDCTQTAFNGTAPNPVQNSEFTELICEVLNRPGVLTAPAALLKLALGEQSTILLSSQRAFPKNFMDCGFKFRFDNLIDALLDLLKYHVNGEVFLKNSLWIDKSPSETFKFFSDERNLEKITPQHMGLKVLGKSTPRIQDGTLIDYKLSLHGIPLKCQTLIKSYIPDEVFVDEQLRGPFTKWHHTHKFRALNSGTLMTDEVIYKIPFGWPGRIFAGGYAESDVKKVFDYRNSTITELV